MPHTMLCPNGYFFDMETYLKMARKDRGIVFGVDTSLINPIDGSDVATAVADALDDASTTIDLGNTTLFPGDVGQLSTGIVRTTRGGTTMHETTAASEGTKMARIRRAVFARHSNPLSAWSRWATIPAVMVPLWTRHWSDAGVVTAWFTINALVFPKPQHNRAYATRAMLGEEQWLVERPRDAALVVNAAASSAGVVAMFGARGRHLKTTVAGTGLQMALTLVYWELMVRRYDRTRSGNLISGASPGTGDPQGV
jgi:hypothetical protein